MLLNRLFRRFRREENGVALIAVVGVMAVGLILSALILSSVIGGISFTSATRANVQSQANAEAGIAAAQAGLQKTGDCAANGGVYAPPSGSTLDYRATVWVKNMTGNWVLGCPSGTQTEVRIISGGDATNEGVAGNTSGDESFVEAVFNVGLPTSVDGPSASAIFTGSGGSISSLSVTSANGNPGDIHILKGDFQCNSGSIINGSVIVAEGNLNLTNTCTITGSAKASGSVTITSAVTIGGDLVASGGGITITNSTVTVAGNAYANGDSTIHGTINGNFEGTGSLSLIHSGWIKKDVRVGGALKLAGRIGLNATSPSTVTTEMTASTAKVGGALRIGGNIKVDTKAIGAPSASYATSSGMVGSIAYNQTGLLGPTPQPVPTIAPWVDWKYQWSDWASGYQLLNWNTGDGCQIGNWNKTSHPSWNAIRNATVPTLVDARGCSTLVLNDVDNAILKTDIVFVVKKMTQGSIIWNSSNAAVKHKLWFLVADGAYGTAGPQCTNGAGPLQVTGSFEIKAPLYGLAYTPCTMTISGTKWRGQIYAGGFAVSSGDSMVYEPIGIPGTDLSGGTYVDPNATPAGLGDMTIIRNRADDGE